MKAHSCWRGPTVAEYLASLAVEFEKEGKFLFPDLGVMEIKEDVWKMYFDEAKKIEGLWSGDHFSST